jgi:putative DNA primase/helicase
VELRSGGQHTIIPPSKHPSGQIVRWERRGEPARIPGEDLAKRVGMVAAAALLARHWDKEGQRHDQSLALCGGLIGGGWGAGGVDLDTEAERAKAKLRSVDQAQP